MADEKLEPLQNGGDRQQQLAQLFQRNYGHLLDSILQSRPLFSQDAERILEGLAARLAVFSGNTDEQFIEWAESIVTPAADRLVEWYDMRREYEGVVFKAIWLVVHKAVDLSGGDPAGTVRALADEVWLWAFQNLDSLMATPGAITTRLYGKAYWTGRAWKTSQLRERNKKADLDVEFMDNSRRMADGDNDLPNNYFSNDINDLAFSTGASRS